MHTTLNLTIVYINKPLNLIYLSYKIECNETIYGVQHGLQEMSDKTQEMSDKK